MATRIIYSLKRRLIKLGDSFSQMINAVVFDGSCNESLSGRSYRENLWTEKWIDLILWFDPKHCFSAYMNDLEYAERYIQEARKRILNRK